MADFVGISVSTEPVVKILNVPLQNAVFSSHIIDKLYQILNFLLKEEITSSVVAYFIPKVFEKGMGSELELLPVQK